MLDFLKSDTFRRAVAFLIGILLPLLNSKLGLNIPNEQVVSAIVLVAGYIAQSVVNSMHARSVDAGAAAAAAVDDKSKAVAELSK